MFYTFEKGQITKLYHHVNNPCLQEGVRNCWVGLLVGLHSPEIMLLVLTCVQPVMLTNGSGLVPLVTACLGHLKWQLVSDCTKHPGFSPNCPCRDECRHTRTDGDGGVSLKKVGYRRNNTWIWITHSRISLMGEAKYSCWKNSLEPAIAWKHTLHKMTEEGLCACACVYYCTWWVVVSQVSVASPTKKLNEKSRKKTWKLTCYFVLCFALFFCSSCPSGQRCQMWSYCFFVFFNGLVSIKRPIFVPLLGEKLSMEPPGLLLFGVWACGSFNSLSKFNNVPFSSPPF